MSLIRLASDSEDTHTLPATERPKTGNLGGVLAEGSLQDFSNEIYTVGWICAITTEYVAAQAFLDERHDRPEYLHPHDNNDYTLGKVGKHNVAIAVLPDGEYGTTSAAGVARDMLHSFPNIRIGLMVGVGGGAPSPDHDIRLGDIVVSAPCNGKGGVYQYDFGKTIQNQTFKTTGFLNQPPTVLRTAVHGLKSQYEIDGHQLDKTINYILEKKPKLQRKYRRPSPDTDKLFAATVIHPPDSDANCAIVCQDNLPTLAPRQKRGEDDDDPAIHYGLIASANQLMKDALLRDKLAKEHGVLCFEMEAAGLMNHFPCLVIRGICDYSDTHKSKEWQGYAAMAAAAYAKDILYRIPPSKVEVEAKISQLLSSVCNDVAEIRCGVNERTVQHRREQIDRWLSAADPATNYNKAIEQRQPGTGAWFLQSNKFQTWNSRRNSFLWLHGIPGCGKSILSSTIVESLTGKASEKVLLYFYFTFSDTSKQSLESVVRSLIGQLYYKRLDTWEHLNSLFTSCAEGSRSPSCESLCGVLLQMIEQIKEVWIVLDALDECTTRRGPPTQGLLSWIQILLSPKERNVHLLVTSRPEEDIVSGLRDLAQDEFEIDIQSDLVSDDIRRYIHARVRDGNGFKRWQPYPDVQDEIETTLVSNANGMFRWAACQLDALEACLDYPSLQKALNSLPRTLDETYSRMLQSISPEYKEIAVRILQFLAFSRRPLTLDEVVDAIAVNLEEKPYFSPKNRMPNPMEITRYCLSLVVLVKSKRFNRNELQLAHFSVKEYLVSDRLDEEMMPFFREASACASLTRVCAAYLLHLYYEALPHELSEIEFPFGVYSINFWTSYARVADLEAEELVGLVEQLVQCLESHTTYTTDTRIAEPTTPLHLAAEHGLQKAVALMLKNGVDVNAQGGSYGNALPAATANGYGDIVRLLLDRGANINAQGGSYGNALYVAIANGYEDIVRLLLDRGANINAQGGSYGNALCAAIANGYGDIVRLLLDRGANINAQGGSYGNALCAAIANGYGDIVRLLLDRGANINAQGGSYGNALCAAIFVSDSRQIVQLLLDGSADINVQGGYHGNALQAASLRGDEHTVQLLLDRGVDINVQGGYHGNALQAASLGGNERTVQLLLDKGANVNAQVGRYGTALKAALAGGHKKIAKLLVEGGADNTEQTAHSCSIEVTTLATDR